MKTQQQDTDQTSFSTITKNLSLNPIEQDIKKCITQVPDQFRLLIVGGWIRNKLLGFESDDIDIVFQSNDDPDSANDDSNLNKIVSFLCKHLSRKYDISKSEIYKITEEVIPSNKITKGGRRKRNHYNQNNRSKYQVKVQDGYHWPV